MAIRGCAILIVLIMLGAFTICNARELNFNVCEQVSAKQLAALSRIKLFPSEQENGCQWSKKPGDMAYFQIGVIESQENLRGYFQKELPPNFELDKINDLGDRGLMTASEGYLSVIAIRKGDWVLISTVNFLNIKHGSGKQKILWDIYGGILQKLQ
jgi:hypothetical protein